MKYCHSCGKEINKNDVFCPFCGKKIDEVSNQSKNRLVAGILGIFLGYIGIHNFYLGYRSRGIAQIIVTFVTCGVGGIWGFIEGIMILVGTINVDSDGNELND